MAKASSATTSATRTYSLPHQVHPYIHSLIHNPMVCTPYEHVPPSPSRITGDYLPTSTGIFWPVSSRFGSSSDIVLGPWCSHLTVPAMSSSVLLLHFDMMSQTLFLDHFLRCLLPSCGICLSFLQRILAHQNFGDVRNLTRGRHFLTTPARLCLDMVVGAYSLLICLCCDKDSIS